MNIREELAALPENIGKRLLQCGREYRLAAGELLPGSQEGFSGIRIILEGEVRVLARLPQGDVTVYRYGPGEALGIRALLRPESLPRLAWRTATDARYLEIDSEEIAALLAQDSGPLRTLLEHAAHLRDLDIMLAIQPLFHALPHEVRERLFEHARPLALAPGHAIDPQQQMPPGSVAMISHGQLRILHGNEAVARLRSGDILAGQLHENGTRIEAEMWSELLLFDQADIIGACRDHPAFAARLGKRSA